MPLTGANDQIETTAAGSDVVEHVIVDAKTIFFGALVIMRDTIGEIDNFTDVASGVVMGIAIPDTESVLGVSTTPRKKVKVDESGLVIRGAAVTGAVQASESDKVFASDENTFTMTPGTHAAIGVLEKFINAGVGDIRLFTPAEAQLQ